MRELPLNLRPALSEKNIERPQDHLAEQRTESRVFCTSESISVASSDICIPSSSQSALESLVVLIVRCINDC